MLDKLKNLRNQLAGKLVWLEWTSAASKYIGLLIVAAVLGLTYRLGLSAFHQAMAARSQERQSIQCEKMRDMMFKERLKPSVDLTKPDIQTALRGARCLMDEVCNAPASKCKSEEPDAGANGRTGR